jgi:hypothetical protein
LIKSTIVVPGVMPGIHAFRKDFVDGRDKPGRNAMGLSLD